MSQTPARLLRALSRVELSRHPSRILTAHDITQLDISRACGVRAQKVQRWCDPESKEVPGVADIEQMPRPIALELLAWGAGKHEAHIVDDLTPASIGDHLRHFAELTREVGELQSAYAAAIADGTIDAQELARLETEIDDVLGPLPSQPSRALAATTERMGTLQ